MITSCNDAMHYLEWPRAHSFTFFFLIFKFNQTIF
jgi:hypothetical protein